MNDRGRAFRRHKERSKQNRRVKDVLNQSSYNDDSAYMDWFLKKNVHRLKEQPQHCSCYMCGNQRKLFGNSQQSFTIQEKRNIVLESFYDE